MIIRNHINGYLFKRARLDSGMFVDNHFSRTNRIHNGFINKVYGMRVSLAEVWCIKPYNIVSIYNFQCLKLS